MPTRDPNSTADLQAQIATKADKTALATKADAAALAAKADVSAIPLPATAMPPAVQDSGAKGVDSRYALADHTHASKARKKRQTGVTAATYTWVYPEPFAVGVIPICNAIVEDPADSGNDSYNAQISGVPSNTQCVFRIKRQSTGLLSLLTGALSLNPTPGNVTLHMSALEP